MSKFAKVGVGLGIFVAFIVVIGIIGSMIEKNDTAIQSSSDRPTENASTSSSKGVESADADKQISTISSSAATATKPASAVAPAAQNARACTPGTVCFLSGDYLRYDTYKDGKLNWETRYTYTGAHGSSDNDNLVTVEKYDSTYDENVKLVVGGKASNNATTLVDFNLCCDLQNQEFIGTGYPYTYEVLQPSPVKIERWLEHPTSANLW